VFLQSQLCFETRPADRPEPFSGNSLGARARSARGIGKRGESARLRNPNPPVSSHGNETKADRGIPSASRY